MFRVAVSFDTRSHTKHVSKYEDVLMSNCDCNTSFPTVFSLVLTRGGIIWEVEGRGSGSKGVAYHTDSSTCVGESV